MSSIQNLSLTYPTHRNELKATLYLQVRIIVKQSSLYWEKVNPSTDLAVALRITNFYRYKDYTTPIFYILKNRIISQTKLYHHHSIYAFQSRLFMNSSSVKDRSLAASKCSFCLFKISINFICLRNPSISSPRCFSSNLTLFSSDSIFEESPDVPF